MRIVEKVWLHGLCCGMAMSCVIGSGLYYAEHGKLPFIGDSLGTGESAKKLATIEKLIDREYLGEIDKDFLEDYMFYGLVAGLGDKYSQYFTVEQYAESTQNSDGAYVGIGIVLQQDTQTNTILVTQCYENSPAQQAGVLEGDVLYQVNEYPSSENTLSELLELPIWDKGEVTLYLQREGVEELLELTVKIGKVEVPSVYFRILEDSMGYIQITQFTEVTSSQFETAYQTLLEAGIKGLIIDLRENPGGLLSSVCNTTRQILPKGLILYTEDAHGKREEYKSDGKTPIEIPLVVLVNENSASAAEVFSGAVKDYQIATLVGTTTFGKGIVQKIFPLKDGSALKLTVAKYYTPNGTNIHEVGISPDIEVTWAGDEAFTDPSDFYKLEQSDWESKDNQFEKAVEVLEDLISQEKE